jgi:alkaline phosphatase D
LRRLSSRLFSFLVCISVAGCAGGGVNFASGDERLTRLIASSTKLSAKALKTNYEISCRDKSAAACYVIGKAGRPADISQLPLLQGPTNETTTQVSLLHDSSDPPDVSLIDKGSLVTVPIRDIQRRTYPGQKTSWTWIRYHGLKLGRTYALIVNHADGSLWDLRTLAPLNPNIEKVKFALAACMDDYYRKEQEGMWRDLLSHKQNLIFLIGDNVYGDKMSQGFIPANGVQLWNRYVDTWTNLALFKTEHLVPTFQTWDDHDYGINDGNRDFPYKDQSKDVMTKVFPRETVKDFYSLGPGVSSTFRLAGQHFMLTDGRYFRTSAKDINEETHWGKEQEDWIFNTLEKTPAPAWLIEGDQFFGKYHGFESYEGKHPQSFGRTLERLKNLKKPVFFISGDRHNTELMKISDLGYTTYEFTTSPIHAITFPEPWSTRPNPRQIAGIAGVHNYGIIEARVTGNTWEMSVAAYGPDKRVLYAKKFSITK